MQIQDVAFKLRQKIIYVSSFKLPEKLKVMDIFKGEAEVPDLLKNFFKYLLGSRDGIQKVEKRRIKSISQDVVYTSSSGIKKPSKHLQLRLATSGLFQLPTLIAINGNQKVEKGE